MMKEKDLNVLHKVLSKLINIRDYAHKFKLKNRVINDSYFFNRLAKLEEDLSEVINILTKFIDKMCSK